MDEQEFRERKAGPLSCNPSTRKWQLAAEESTKQGNTPGTHPWWQCIRRELGLIPPAE